MMDDDNVEKKKKNLFFDKLCCEVRYVQFVICAINTTNCYVIPTWSISI